MPRPGCSPESATDAVHLSPHAATQLTTAAAKPDAAAGPPGSNAVALSEAAVHRDKTLAVLRDLSPLVALRDLLPLAALQWLQVAQPPLVTVVQKLVPLPQRKMLLLLPRRKAQLLRSRITDCYSLRTTKGSPSGGPFFMRTRDLKSSETNQSSYFLRLFVPRSSVTSPPALVIVNAQFSVSSS